MTTFPNTEFHQKCSYTLYFSAFGNVVKHGLSCLMYVLLECTSLNLADYHLSTSPMWKIHRFLYCFNALFPLLFNGEGPSLYVCGDQLTSGET